MGKKRKNRIQMLKKFIIFFIILWLLGVILPMYINDFLNNIPDIYRRPKGNSIFVNSYKVHTSLKENIYFVIKKYIELNY